MRVQVRRVRSHIAKFPSVGRQLFACQMGSFLCLLMGLVSLLCWIGPLIEMGFDWRLNDVNEVEILQFSSPYPQVHPEHITSVKDAHVLARLFDGLNSATPYISEHEHAMGNSYVLQLRHRSNDQWSSYRIKIYPDRESYGGLHMKGVYVISVDYGSCRFNTGSCYQAQTSESSSRSWQAINSERREKDTRVRS